MNMNMNMNLNSNNETDRGEKGGTANAVGKILLCA